MKLPGLSLAASLAIGLAAAPVLGAISFSGPNSPTGPGDGNVETTLEIGFGDDPDDVDPRATVTVDAASTLEFDEIYVGSDEGFFGRMFVSGDGTKVTAEEDGSTSEPTFQVGREGDGYLLVDDGAWLDLPNQSADLTIGNKDTSVGRAIFTDPFTLVSIGQNLIVGDEGVARLDILNGALVRTLDSTSAGVTIGAVAGGVGEVYVDGAGTRLRVGDDLTVGGQGHGYLSISNQAVLDADNSQAPFATVGVEGRVALDGGTLLIQGLTNNGVLGGSGLVRGSGVVTNGFGGRIDVGAGQRLTFDAIVVNQGDLQVDGGEAEFLESLTVSAAAGSDPPGRITLESGTVRLTETLANNGSVAATEGASDIYGEVTNETDGVVTVARDAVLTFHDTFTDNGGTVQVLAGGNAIFLADATFAASSTVALAVATEEAGAPIAISGSATLGGELQVEFPVDFEPSEGEIFTLLEADEIIGEFIPPVFPTLDGGLELGLVTGGTSVLIEVFAGSLPGDFNGDGVVDAADYTVWRDNGLPQSDYDVWAGNYGASAATSSANNQPVPEPSALALLVLCGGMARRR